MNSRIFGSPEIQLLIDIVRYDNPQELNDELLKFSRYGIDWHRLASSRFSTILYHKTNDIHEDLGIPPEVFSGWKEAHSFTTVRNMYALEIVKKMAGEFKKNRIDSVYLKGVAELSTVYMSDPGLRPMDDIDILVHPEDKNSAEKILIQALGYKKSGRYPSCDRESYNNGSNIPVDLHWGIFPKEDSQFFRLEDKILSGTFNMKRRITVGDAEINIPDPTGLFIILSVHGVNRFHLPSALQRHWRIFGSKNAGGLIRHDLEEHLLLMSFRMKKLLGYCGSDIDWDRVKASLGGLETDPSLRLLFSVCRMCCVKEIPDDFYSMFGIPDKTCEKSLKRLIRKIDDSYMGDFLSDLIKRKIGVKEFLSVLLVYIFGVDLFFRLKTAYRRPQRR